MATQASCAPSLNDVFAKPKRPAEFIRPGMQTTSGLKKSEKHRKFLQLKEKIMRTDELIQKYRLKVGECEEYKQQLKEVQTKLSIEEKGRKGLLAELNTLHKKSESLQREKEMAHEELERLQLSIKEEQLVKEQLMVQVSELRGDRETSDHLKNELSVTKSEMERYKKMYQNLKQVYEAFKADRRHERIDAKRKRRVSEAISLPTPLISPPPSYVVLSPPLSTCSLPLPLSGSAASSIATELPIDIEQSSSQPLTTPEEHQPSSILFNSNTVKIEDDQQSLGFGTFDVDDGEKGCTYEVDDVIFKRNDVIVSDGKRTCTTECDKVSLFALPDVRVTTLSDDSDSEEEDCATMPCVIPRSPPRGQIRSKQDAFINVDRKPLNISSDNNSPERQLNMKLPTVNCTLQVGNDSSHQSNKVATMPVVKEGTMPEPERDLNAELFGDFDDNLSVSDSSSCCSLSSLSSVDELADLLRSTSNLGDKDVKQEESRTRNEVVDANNSCVLVEEREEIAEDGVVVSDGEVGSADANAAKNLVPDDHAPFIPVAGQDHACDVKESSMLPGSGNGQLLTSSATSNDSAAKLETGGPSDTKELDSHDTLDHLHLPEPSLDATAMDVDTTSTAAHSDEPLCNGPSLFLPKIKVEAVAADTASSDDSDCEMDVSFSTLFGDEFQIISPLPPSPFNPRICCVATPLSPLPPSPSKRELLSPLPQTPRQVLETISPLPPSPVNAHQSPLSPLSSPHAPIPQSHTLNGAHCGSTSADSAKSEAVCREDDVSPVQFDDAVPPNICAPKPCCLSISVDAASTEGSCSDPIGPCTTGSAGATPSPRNRKLRLSEGSPFSPLTFVLPSPAETGSVFDPSPANTTPSSVSDASRTTVISSSATTEVPSPVEEAIPVFEALPLSACGKLTSTSSSLEDGSLESTGETFAKKNVKAVETTVEVKDKENVDNVIVPSEQPVMESVDNPSNSTDVVVPTEHLVGESVLRKGVDSPSNSSEIVEAFERGVVQECEGDAGVLEDSAEGGDSTASAEDREKSYDGSTELPSQLVTSKDENKSDTKYTVKVQSADKVSAVPADVVVKSEGIIEDNLSTPLGREDGKEEDPLDGEIAMEEHKGKIEESLSTPLGREDTKEEYTEHPLDREMAKKEHKDGEVAMEVNTGGNCSSRSECTGVVDELEKVAVDVANNGKDSTVESAEYKAVDESVPLSSESGDHPRTSPVEEGEVSDSDEGAEEEGGLSVPSEERVAHLEEREERSTAMMDCDLLQPPPNSNLQTKNISVNSSPPHPLPFSNSSLMPLHQCRQQRSNESSTNKQQSSLLLRRPLKADSSTNETTFDSLLDAFCSSPKTRSRAKSKTVPTSNHAQESPNPLTRLRSSVRNNKKAIGQLQKSRAAEFIGLSSKSSVSNPLLSNTSCSVSGTQVASHKLDKRVCLAPDGKNKAGKRLDNDNVATQPPASKRIKLEDGSSSAGNRLFEEKPADLAETAAKATNVSTSTSPLEATAPQGLPGYKIHLRSRVVNVSGDVWSPRKRRTSSSSCLGEESRHPMNKKKKRNRLSSPSRFVEEEESGSLKVYVDSVNTDKATKDGGLQAEDKLLDIKRVCLKGVEQSEDLATQCTSNVSIPFAEMNETCSLRDDSRHLLEPQVKDKVDAVTLPPPSASLSTGSPRQETTSILAESYDLFGSDSADSDESLVIGDLDSLLDREGDEIAHSSQPSSCNLTLASNSVQRKPHVRKTDSATGQEEDQTPASSPKTGSDIITKQLSSLIEQKTVVVSVSTVLTQPPPSLSNVSAMSLPPAPRMLPSAHSSVAVGYGQPQQAPLPKYTPPTSSTSPKKGIKPSRLDGIGPSSCSATDILHTPLPQFEKPGKIGQNSLAQRELDKCVHEKLGVGGQISIPLAQRELNVCMQSPLPLPQWLVAAMTRVQAKQEHCTASGMALGKKKRGNAKEPIMRQRKQKLMDYVLINLERLVSGHLHLSTILAMFTNQKNVSELQPFIDAVIKFLQTRYNPKIEHVVSVFHSLCDDVRVNPRDMDPHDGRFPPALLRPECQLVALFLLMSQLSPVMAALLPEMNKTLYQLLVSRQHKFHKLCAFARILTAICRLQGDSDRVLFLAFDLLKKPVSVNELPVFAALACVWPMPLARKRGVKLVENRRLLLKGLEPQLLNYTLEVLVMNKLRSEEAKMHGKLSTHLHTLCQWFGGNDKKITTLTESLMQLLNTSDGVYIVSPPKAAGASDSTPWHRPRPSVLAFHIVHCMRMISCDQGWVWTNDTLIRAHLWPLLQQWNAKQDSVREATIVCAVRLIGFISQQGLTHDIESSSVGQLQRVLVALLNKSDQVSFPVQLAAIDSLLELCPPSHARTPELVGVVKAWLKQQSGKPHGSVLFQELCPRLQAFNV